MAKRIVITIRQVAVMYRPLFTIALAVALLSTGIATGAVWERVDPWILQRFGFAPVDLRTGAWHRILTSAFFITGGINFWKVQFLIAASCGTYEVRHGARRVAVAFAFTHIATLLIGSLVILPFVLAGADWAVSLDRSYDLGPSAGCYGCFGMLLGELPRAWRWLLLFGIVAMTGGNVAWHCHLRDIGALSGDLDHVIAIALGFMARRMMGSAASPEPAPKEAA